MSPNPKPIPKPGPRPSPTVQLGAEVREESKASVTYGYSLSYTRLQPRLRVVAGAGGVQGQGGRGASALASDSRGAAEPACGQCGARGRGVSTSLLALITCAPYDLLLTYLPTYLLTTYYLPEQLPAARGGGDITLPLQYRYNTVIMPLHYRYSYLLLEAEETANDKEEETATKAIIEASRK